MRANVIHFCPSNQASKSPEGLTFLRSFADVQLATNDSQENARSINSLASLANTGVKTAVVVMLPNGSCRNRDPDRSAHIIGRGVHEAIVEGDLAGVRVFALTQPIDGISWQFQRVIRTSRIANPRSFVEYAHAVVDNRPQGVLDCFNYPVNKAEAQAREWWLHAQNIEWNGPANTQVRYETDTIMDVYQKQAKRAKSPKAKPSPRLTNAAVWYYQRR